MEARDRWGRGKPPTRVVGGCDRPTNSPARQTVAGPGGLEGPYHALGLLSSFRGDSSAAAWVVRGSRPEELAKRRAASERRTGTPKSGPVEMERRSQGVSIARGERAISSGSIG